MEHRVYEEMYAVEDRHWWFAAKRRIVIHFLKRYLPAVENSGEPASRRRVVDLGCGCGAMLHRLKARYDAVGLDGSPLAIAFCERRGISANLAVLPDEPGAPPSSADAVLMLDVLEHLKDDVAGLAAAVGLLKPGGIFIATVPAYPWLWSAWDDVHHHYRRYTSKSLRSLVTNAGLEIETLSYGNSFLFPIAAAVRLLKRSRPMPPDRPPMRVPGRFANYMLRKIYAAERHLIGRVPMPFGLSVVVVARKPKTAGAAAKLAANAVNEQPAPLATASS